MQLGMIGLGRMGGNMVRRLMRGGHECVVFDLNPDNVKALEADGAKGAAVAYRLSNVLDRVWHCFFQCANELCTSYCRRPDITLTADKDDR